MNAQTPLPGMTSAAQHEADLRSRGDDPTPRGVVRAVLEAAYLIDVVPHDRRVHIKGGGFETRTTDNPVRVLDVCAGYGCWASEFRRLCGLISYGPELPIHITGVELDERKREHLSKWCDDASMMDWRYLLDTWATIGRKADLVIGNPDFAQLTHEDPEQSMPAVLLRHAPAVLLLHTQQAFLKSEAGRKAWRAYPPAASWLVPGGVKFRGARHGADSRCYQVTLWLRDHKGPCAVHLLDDLTPGERSWSQLPGTEDAIEAKALGLPMVGEPA